MLPWLALALGALVGVFLARKRGGNGFDIAQYAVVLGIIGWVIGYTIALIVLRMG